MSKSNQQQLNEYFVEGSDVDVKLYLGNVDNESTESVCGDAVSLLTELDNGGLANSPLRNERYGIKPKACATV